MIEVRFHGRGGQGAVMASRIMANAFVRIGQYGASFPMFGFERRGAPVTAFGRFDALPVREKTQIYNPHIVVVLDPSQKYFESVYKGLRTDAVLILNAGGPLTKKAHPNLKKAGIVNADQISTDEVGRALPNTCMLGAFAATTGLLPIESLTEALGDYFEGSRLEANKRCLIRGYEETKVNGF
jgi:2-oxoacid:acceptor oxidoreductase gamma subunit (pyruvate/2-ketoisovalerate family)